MDGVSPLIRPGVLAPLLGSVPPPVVLDVRWRLGGPPGLPDHLAGHLPGAVFIDLGAELADPSGPGGRHPLPDRGRLAETFASAGVRAASTVIAYDDGDGSVAARAWWLLRWLGFPQERVMVLDGGWAAWRAGGHPVSTGVPVSAKAPAPVVPAYDPAPSWGQLMPPAGGMPVLDADDAAGLARHGVLLDARASTRYRGDTEPVDPRAGHIPGARNAPFGEHLGPDGYWRAPAELAERFRELGVTPDGPVGAYCGSGVTACSVVLALEYSGLRAPLHRPAALYAGSWSQWSADPSRPVALGARPEDEADSQ
ncbi:MAG: sulfurtransferase [Actinomycetota bacterium]|nr:sulfurtransferase [Actinomycetota bacterium]